MLELEQLLAADLGWEQEIAALRSRTTKGGPMSGHHAHPGRSGGGSTPHHAASMAHAAMRRNRRQHTLNQIMAEQQAVEEQQAEKYQAIFTPDDRDIVSTVVRGIRIRWKPLLDRALRIARTEALAGTLDLDIVQRRLLKGWEQVYDASGSMLDRLVSQVVERAVVNPPSDERLEVLADEWLNVFGKTVVERITLPKLAAALSALPANATAHERLATVAQTFTAVPDQLGMVLQPMVRRMLSYGLLTTLPAQKWDEEAHPREPAGSPGGGQFISSGGTVSGGGVRPGARSRTRPGSKPPERNPALAAALAGLLHRRPELGEPGIPRGMDVVGDVGGEGSQQVPPPVAVGPEMIDPGAMTVGITSFPQSRPWLGSDPSVLHLSPEVRNFRTALAASGATIEEFVPTTGGWLSEGTVQTQPSIAVRLGGATDANKVLPVLANQAKQWNQDAVLVVRHVSSSDKDAVPRYTWTLGASMAPSHVKELEQLAKEAGFPGWTIEPNQGQIHVQTVPDFQSTEDTAKAAARFHQLLLAHPLFGGTKVEPPRMRIRPTRVQLLRKEDNYGGYASKRQWLGLDPGPSGSGGSGHARKHGSGGGSSGYRIAGHHFRTALTDQAVAKGSATSGNYGHTGRPGLVGGSGPGEFRAQYENATERGLAIGKQTTGVTLGEITNVLKKAMPGEGIRPEAFQGYMKMIDDWSGGDYSAIDPRGTNTFRAMAHMLYGGDVYFLGADAPATHDQIMEAVNNIPYGVTADEMTTIMGIHAGITQAILRRRGNYDSATDTVTLMRGMSVKENSPVAAHLGGDEFLLSNGALSSYTTERIIAKNFASRVARKGVILEAKVPVKAILMDYGDVGEVYEGEALVFGGPPIKSRVVEVLENKIIPLASASSPPSGGGGKTYPKTPPPGWYGAWPPKPEGKAELPVVYIDRDPINREWLRWLRQQQKQPQQG